MTDISAARRFVQLHGRLLDRRRFAHLVDGGRAEEVVAAVAAYGNPDGGYAGVIEPDVRTLSSQPIAALTAFEVLDEVGATPSEAPLAWLESVSNADGGLPFALPAADDAPHAPWMVPSGGSSLHMTTALAAAATRLRVEGPWIERARAYCHERLADLGTLSAYETKYAVDLLDAAGEAHVLDRLRERMPVDGRLPVQGGAEGEALTLLDLAPNPQRLARRLFTEAQVDRALDELDRRQREDGGWDFDWLAWSPVVAYEWRARLTVDALAILRANGR